MLGTEKLSVRRAIAITIGIAVAIFIIILIAVILPDRSTISKQKNTIEELQKKIKSLEHENTQLTNGIQQIREARRTNVELSDAEIHRLSAIIKDLRKKLEATTNMITKAEYDKVASQLAGCRQHVAELTKKLDDSSENYTTNYVERTKYEKLKSDLNARIAELTKKQQDMVAVSEYNKLVNDRDKLQTQLTEYQNNSKDVAALQQQINKLNTTIQMYKTTYISKTKYNSTLTQLNNIREQIKLQQTTYTSSLKSIYDEIKKLMLLVLSNSLLTKEGKEKVNDVLNNIDDLSATKLVTKLKQLTNTYDQSTVQYARYTIKGIEETYNAVEKANTKLKEKENELAEKQKKIDELSKRVLELSQNTQNEFAKCQSLNCKINYITSLLNKVVSESNLAIYQALMENDPNYRLPILSMLRLALKTNNTVLDKYYNAVKTLITNISDKELNRLLCNGEGLDELLVYISRELYDITKELMGSETVIYTTNNTIDTTNIVKGISNLKNVNQQTGAFMFKKPHGLHIPLYQFFAQYPQFKQLTYKDESESYRLLNMYITELFRVYYSVINDYRSYVSSVYCKHHDKRILFDALDNMYNNIKMTTEKFIKTIMIVNATHVSSLFDNAYQYTYNKNPQFYNPRFMN